MCGCHCTTVLVFLISILCLFSPGEDLPNQNIGLVDARLQLLALVEGMVRAGTCDVWCTVVCVFVCEYFNVELQI